MSLQKTDIQTALKTDEGNELFPVFLKLNQLRLLLVGAGNVGFEKLTAVIGNSPKTSVKIVASEVSEQVLAFADAYPNIKIYPKDFDVNDLTDVDVVMVATNNPELNGFIRLEAKARNLLVNFADKPDICDFYLGSVVKKGDLKLSISTNGKSPTIAKRLKEVLNDGLPAEINDSLQQMQALRNTLKGDFAFKVKELNKATEVLVEPKIKQGFSFTQIGIYLLSALGLMLVGHLLFSLIPLREVQQTVWTNLQTLDETFLYFVLGGFVAQMIDGALGMAYGVSATTFLLSFGVTPAIASASVHASEIFTSGVSGLMHLKFGNVRSKLFKNLLIPGILGAIIGAYVLSSLENYNYIIKPLIGAYTLFLGVKIIIKAMKKNKRTQAVKKIIPLAFFGGLFDAIGGGGWGPIVSSTLISKGKNPRTTIGSVNLAEFFVALASSITFITVLGFSHWDTVLGLVLGGVIAAPIAARLSSKLPVKALMLMVGIVVIVVSLRIVYLAVMDGRLNAFIGWIGI